MFRLLIYFSILFQFPASPLLAADQYFKAEAQPGDGIYSILRRYGLDNFGCNFDKFHSLNNLKQNARLQVGKSYFIPILIYEFNGKTIRSSINNSNYDLALTIQRYNEEMLSKGVRKESFKTDRQLWVPYHLLHCPSDSINEAEKKEIEQKEKEEEDAPKISNPVDEETKDTEGILPVTSNIPANKRNKDREFPIFGPDYAYTPLISSKLKGKVFYISAGHGGPDPGAIGKYGNAHLCEDEYAYDVSLRLCRNLISHGATAYMINRDDNDGIRKGSILKCDTDEVLWGDIKMVNSQKTRLFQRSDIINELFDKHKWQGVKDQLAIMIHVDSRSKKEQTDLYFYYHPESEESSKIASKLRDKMDEKYQQYQKNRSYRGTVTARDLHMLRETKTNSVYIELANIKNPTGQQRIVSEKNRQLLADWLLAGILSL